MASTGFGAAKPRARLPALGRERQRELFSDGHRAAIRRRFAPSFVERPLRRKGNARLCLALSAHSPSQVLSTERADLVVQACRSGGDSLHAIIHPHGAFSIELGEMGLDTAGSGCL